MLANFDYYRNSQGRKILVRRGAGRKKNLTIQSRSEQISRLGGTVAGVGGALIAYDAFSKPERISKTAVGLGLGTGLVIGSGVYKLHRYLERRSRKQN